MLKTRTALVRIKLFVSFGPINHIVGGCVSHILMVCQHEPTLHPTNFYQIAFQAIMLTDRMSHIHKHNLLGGDDDNIIIYSQSFFGYAVSSVCLGSALWPPRLPLDILIRCLYHLSCLLLMKKRSSSNLSSSRVTELRPHPVSKAEPRHALEVTHFRSLYPRSYSFGYYPQLVTISAGRSIDRQLCFHAQLSFRHIRPVQLLHHYRWGTNLFLSRE